MGKGPQIDEIKGYMKPQGKELVVAVNLAFTRTPNMSSAYQTSPNACPNN